MAERSDSLRLLILDVGTSSMRGTLMDGQGRQLDQVQIHYQPSYFSDGRVEQSPDDWLDAMDRISKHYATRDPIDAIALTSQRSSVIPVDALGSPLAPAIMWQDDRNQGICTELERESELFHTRCGSFINTVYSGTKMAWLRRHEPTLYHKAVHLPVIPDYLLYHLTGDFVTDDPYASRSLMMDLVTCQWDDELLELLGVQKEKLSRIIPAGSIAGYVSEKWAHRTGVPAGLPVISCGGDQQCAALGEGACTPGTATINLGTGGYLVAVTDKFPNLQKIKLNCNTYAIPGTYMLEYDLLACGAAVDWALKLLYGRVDSAQIDFALRRSIPGAGGIDVLPYFQGRSGIEWKATERASISGMSLATTRYDILRGILEGICGEFARGMREMEEIQPIFSLSVGGGLSNSDDFCQLLADYLDRPVTRCAKTEATTIGAWASAVVRLGAYENCQAALDAVPFSRGKTFVPDQVHAGFYRKMRKERSRVYAGTIEKASL